MGSYSLQKQLAAILRTKEKIFTICYVMCSNRAVVVTVGSMLLLLPFSYVLGITPIWLPYSRLICDDTLLHA